VVGDDVTSVDRVGGIEFPGQLDADGSRCSLHLLKKSTLLLTLEFIFGSDQVNGNFFIVCFLPCNRFQKLHEIARLVEEANVRVGDDDVPARRAGQGRTVARR
jgi:hypothetical protein